MAAIPIWRHPNARAAIGCGWHSAGHTGAGGLTKAKHKNGSPIVDEALLRIAALYKIEDSICAADSDQRQAIRQSLSRPLVNELFNWLTTPQGARVSCKSEIGEAMAPMLKGQDGFRLFLMMAASTSTPASSRTPSAARP